MNAKNYTLTLSDGTTWGFTTASGNLRNWLESFANILKMRVSDSGAEECDYKIRFAEFAPSDIPSPCDTAGNGDWKFWLKNAGSSRLWRNSSGAEILMELNSEFVDHKDIKFINMTNCFTPFYHHYGMNGGSPVHAAFAGLNGNGFLIAAEGDTGKTTSLMRLPDYYEKLADDTALVVKNGNDYLVHPMPTWSDHLTRGINSSFDTHRSLPLKAVFFLEQADNDEVIPLRPGNAVSRLFESFKQSWNPYWKRMDEDMSKQCKIQVFENALEIVKSVPCYRLKATLTGNFWKEIENTSIINKNRCFC